MADAVTQFSTLSAVDAINAYIAIKQFELSERNLVLGRYAEKFSLPQRMGKTLRVTRHKRLTLPTAPLTEGVPPDAVALSIESVDVTVEQWGIVVLLTDVVQITLTHPALQKAIELTGLAMAEMFEREMAEMLLAGTNVVFGGSATTRAGLVAGDKLTTLVVLKVTTALRARGAMPWEGQLYAGCMAPQQEADLIQADTVFQSASNFANVRQLQYGEVGIWMGARWGRSNFIPIFKGLAAGSYGDADVTNPSATLPVYEGTTGGTFTANAPVKVSVVARDANSDYERRFNQESNTAIGAGNTALKVRFPNSANYVYDVYIDDAAAGGGTARLYAARQAANSLLIVTAPAATTAATPPSAPASGVEVFVGWVFGKDAWGRVELNGMSLQSYLTPAGASYSNPLAQGRKVGSKVMWKSFILDNAYFSRIETGSAFPSELPA